MKRSSEIVLSTGRWETVKAPAHPQVWSWIHMKGLLGGTQTHRYMHRHALSVRYHKKMYGLYYTCAQITVLYRVTVRQRLQFKWADVKFQFHCKHIAFASLVVKRAATNDYFN